MKDSTQDPRIQAWFNDRPELLVRYPNHWVVVNVKRFGVSIAEVEQAEMLKRYEQERGRLYNKGQPMDEVFLVHTSSFRGRVVKE